MTAAYQKLQYTADPMEYVPLVKRLAKRLARRLPEHVEVDELVSAGMVGLLEAARRFDPSRNIDFGAFAEFRVRGAMLDELRRRDLMARDARSEAKRIESAMGELAKSLGRPPEEPELAAHLGMDLAELQKNLERLTPVRVSSLDDGLSEWPRNIETPFDSAAKRQTRQHLAAAIAKLNERQQTVLHLYYQEELTLKQIGVVLEVSESRVSQILTQTTLQLRAYLGAPEAP